MRALVSVDLEGMPYTVIPGHLDLKGTLYEEARKIATKITFIVADELSKNGFDRVIVADSHGPMVNVHIDDLPEHAEIIRGFPRPLSMVAGVDGCDAAVFLGYHGKFGTTRSSFDHTFFGAYLTSLEINGLAVSEFLFNAYVAGEFEVPVMMVAGEATLIADDVKKHAPWAETVTLKQSLMRFSARSSSMKVIEKELREATRRAVTKYMKKGCEPLKTTRPVKMKLTLQKSHFADIAEMLPGARRMGGLVVEYTATDILDAQNVFELLMLASAGMASVLEKTG